MASPSSRERLNRVVRQQLVRQGFNELGRIRHGLTPAELCEEVILRHEGHLSEHGAVVVDTGVYTGRSANDKYIVDESSSRKRIAWGKINRPFSEEDYMRLRGRIQAYLQGRDLYVQDCLVGADSRHQRSLRVVTVKAWHSLFACNLFLQIGPSYVAKGAPDFTLIAAPDFKAIPTLDGTRSEAFIVLNLKRREILIGGTHYAGEIKKSIFSIMNYLMPLEGVLPMHCSANVGESGDVALFFGLSGTGKTTLSTDPVRKMIGDDEHGWSEQGVFNFEGGCYAKAIRLSPAAEPEIFACTRRFGTVLENVSIDPVARVIDLDSDGKTENTRAAYPLCALSVVQKEGMGGHPNHVIMLSADAFGVLPPVARLTPEQAMWCFLSGYTAKLAGTERDLTEPQATFSACFGAPFMPLDPVVYAVMLGEKLAKTRAQCWLVNTGWTGGGAGVGVRMPIAETRAIVNSILDGRLNTVPVRKDRFFGLEVPTVVPGVVSQRLEPRKTWSDAKAYDAKAAFLAQQFRDNFQQFAPRVSEAVRASLPPGQEV